MKLNKGYLVKHSFNSEFVDCLDELYKKYGEEIFSIQGIANRHMDIAEFSSNFFNKSANAVSDISVDGNANVREKNIMHYNYENNKSLMKVESLYLMFKYVWKKFDLESAKIALDKVVSGEIFINDLTSFNSPYCYAFDLRVMLESGLNFYDGNMHIGPPKRSDSFIIQVIQATSYISNQIVGACLYKDQELIFKRDEIVKHTFINSDNQYFPKDISQTLNRSIKIKEFVNKFNLNDKFEWGSQNWEACNIKDENISVWENGKYVKVNRVYRRKYSDKIYEIKTSKGKCVRVSKDHIFKVYFRGREIEVSAENLKLYDTLHDCDNVAYDINKDSQDYKDGQFIGILCGDGCLTYDTSISVSVNYKQSFISDFLKQYCLNKFEKEGVVVPGNGCNTWALYKKSVLEYIKTNCISGKYCYDKDIQLDDKSLEFLVGFLDGMLVTDGDGGLSIGLCNENLIKRLQTILSKFNISRQISNDELTKCHDKRTMYGLKIPPTMFKYLDLICKRSVRFEKNVHRDFVFHVGKYCSARSQDKSACYDKKGYTSTKETGDGNIRNLTTDVIVEINTFLNDDDYVYEIETESHWYSVGGLLCHNCSYPDLFAILDWYYRKENGESYISSIRKGMTEKGTPDYDKWYEIKNQFQNLIYSFNWPFRGNQSCFVNLSVLDKGFMNSLFSNYQFPDYSKPNIDSTIELSKIFFEYLTEIQSKEGIFTFPVMTLAISIDDNKNYIDPDFVNWVAEIGSKKAAGNIFVSKPTSFASCCRLKNSYDKVGDVGYSSSFGVGGLSIGSHRVVGLNLARLAILKKDKPSIVDENIDICWKILYSHRKLIEDMIAGGFLPLYTNNWIHLSRQYSTFGFVGGYEYVKNQGLDIKTEKGVNELTSFLSHLEKKVAGYQEQYKKERVICNIEQIPAESMAVRLCNIDTILGYNIHNSVMYSNQYIPLIEDCNIYDRFRIQGTIDGLTSGGAILHLNVDDESLLSKEQFKMMIDLSKKTGTTYWAVNYCYSECTKKHFVVGKHDECPICHSPIKNYFTRVVGFLTPVKSWIKTRREYEFPKRVFYNNDQVEKDVSEGLVK